MPSFCFVDANENTVVVNPAQVATVRASVVAARNKRAHRVELSLAGGGQDGLRRIAVAEFAKRDDAGHICARIGEHLWDEAALSEEETRLIAENPPTEEAGAVPEEMATVPTEQSRHPALVTELRGRGRTKPRSAKV